LSRWDRFWFWVGAGLMWLLLVALIIGPMVLVVWLVHRWGR